MTVNQKLFTLFGIRHCAFFNSPDTTPRIRNIAFVARDNVHMQMKDSLAGSSTDIHTDIVAVGTIFFIENGSYPKKKFIYRKYFVHGCFKELRDMPLGYNQDVPLIYRKLVIESLSKFVVTDDLCTRFIAENTPLWQIILPL